MLECEANMAATQDKYLTVKEASEMLGVAPNTLRSWGATGKIDEYRHPVNNYRLYRIEDVTELRDALLKPVKKIAGIDENGERKRPRGN